jgi:cytochrome c-type biogenesis protein CcmE
MRKGRTLLLLAAVAASLAWVATQSLGGALVYYLTPSDVLGQGDAAFGARSRLGGYVLPGTVRAAEGVVRFEVTDGASRLAVVATGALPDLFREGQGVVVEGALEADGMYHADTVLVKHDSVYRPPNPGETANRLWLDVSRP